MVILIVALILFVVVFNGIQQHKEKQEAEKRAKLTKQKAILDESEELLMSLTMLPANIGLSKVLQRRSLNAVKAMVEISGGAKDIKKRHDELEARLNVTNNQTTLPGADETFMVPDNDQQLLALLQCIKKLRVVLKSEQTKSHLEPSEFIQEDGRLEVFQLRINVESLIKRGQTAQEKEMIGSARQYYEKALKIVSEYPKRSDYVSQKKAELEATLDEISNALKSTNAEDRAKEAKDEQDDLDVLFQPKKKW